MGSVEGLHLVSYCQVTKGKLPEIRGQVVPPDVGGVALNRHSNWGHWPINLKWMWFVYFYLSFSGVQFSVFAACFSWMKSGRRKCEIWVTLKLAPNTAIALKQICALKISVRRQSRWWCRKILNSSPPTDTLNLQLHVGNFSLYTRCTPPCHQMRKGLHSEVRRSWDVVSPQTPPPAQRPTVRRELKNPKLLLDEWRVCRLYQSL